MKRFPGGLVFKAHRLLYHFTLGLRVIKKKKIETWFRMEKVVSAETRHTSSSDFGTIAARSYPFSFKDSFSSSTCLGCRV